MVWNPLDRNWICVDCYINYFGTDGLKNGYMNYLKRQEEVENVIDNLYKLLKE